MSTNRTSEHGVEKTPVMGTISTPGHGVEIPGFSTWLNWWRAQVAQHRALEAISIVLAATKGKSRTDVARLCQRLGLGKYSQRRAGDLWEFIARRWTTEELFTAFGFNLARMVVEERS